MSGRFSRDEKRRLAGFGAGVVALHALGWGLMIAYVAPRWPFMLGLGGLAYTFGLRHAFDADHISAIDNTTRKLLQDGRRPVGAGFYFSLGHSTIVLAMTLALSLATRTLRAELPFLHELGSYAGTAVSGVFLYAIALINLAAMLDVYRVLRRARAGRADEAELERSLRCGGALTRIFGRAFALMRESWHMYPLGLLFGLGFDTATEIGLLGVSGGAASRHIPILAVLTLPLIFAAGMCMMDTADGAFMYRAYGWAFARPARKLFYNLTVTGLSVGVALLVGSIELVSTVTGNLLHVHEGLWGWLQNLDLEKMGYAIVALFVLTWVLAVGVWKLGGVEARWEAALRRKPST